MTETVADIAVQVGFDIGPLQRGAAQAKAVMTGFQGAVSRAGSALESTGRIATRAGAAMSIVTAAVAGAGAAMFAMAKQGADLGDAIAEASRAAGMAPGYYQEMAFAIGQVANVSSEDFAAAMAKLNTTLGQAEQGSTSAIAAFTAIGISQADLESGAVSSQQAMDALVKTLGETKDPAIAAAITADLLGRTGGKMGAQLAGASGEVASLRDRARELGVVMSDEAVKAADNFNDKWGELGQSFDRVKLAIANELLPVITKDLIPALQDTVIPAILKVISVVGEWIRWFERLPQPIKDFTGYLVGAFALGGPVVLAIGAVATAIGALVAGAGAPVVLLIAAAAGIMAAWATWGDDFKAAIGPAVDWVVKKFQVLLDMLNAIKEAATAAFDWTAKAAAPIANAIGAGDPSTFTPNPDYVPGPEAGWGAPEGAAVADGLANGMIDQLDARMPDIEGALQTVTDKAKDVYDTHSPSQVFAEIGQNIGAGLAEGITSTNAMVAASMQTVGASTVSSMQGFAGQALSVLGDMFTGSKAIAAAQALVNAWAGASEALKMPFPMNMLAFGQVLATGLGAVKAIQGTHIGSTSTSSGGSTGGSGGGTSTAAPSAAPLQVSLTGFSMTDMFSGQMFATLLDGLNAEAGDRGYTILVPA